VIQEIQIRSAEASDLSGLVDLIARYWEHEGIPNFDAAEQRSLLERLLADPALGRAFVALRGADLVAYLIGVFVLSLEHRGLTVEIDELFVIAGERSRGVGVALLRTAEASFREIGCTSIQLQLERGNERARHFYHRQGYTERSPYELLDKTLRRD
jgi:ribosomal protein S18 acetylase RimI-like enzyme